MFVVLDPFEDWVGLVLCCFVYAVVSQSAQRGQELNTAENREEKDHTKQAAATSHIASINRLFVRYVS